MFRFIRNLFGETPTEVPVSKSSKPAAVEVEKSPPVPSAGISSWAALKAAPAAVPVASHISRLPSALPLTGAPATAQQPTIDIPFQIVADRLRRRWHETKSAPGAHRLGQAPLHSTLEQLARGTVRISFRTLRDCLPRDLFSPGLESDSALIELPLAEVLARVHPPHLKRRADQKALSDRKEFRLFSAPPHCCCAGTAQKQIQFPRPLLTARAMSWPAAESLPVPLFQQLHPTAVFLSVSPVPYHPARGCSARRTKPAARLPSPERITLAPSPQAPRASEAEPIKVPLSSLARNWPIR